MAEAVWLLIARPIFADHTKTEINLIRVVLKLTGSEDFVMDEKGETVYISPWNWLYQKVLIHVPGAPENGSLLYAICVIIFMWAICYWLDRRKIYIKV